MVSRRGRQVACSGAYHRGIGLSQFLQGRAEDAPKTYTDRMKERFDTALGRYLYSRRLGIVEPVFSNICHIRGLNRFTVRGKVKVDIQWKLYSMVHNILKILRYSPRFT